MADTVGAGAANVWDVRGFSQAQRPPCAIALHVIARFTPVTSFPIPDFTGRDGK